MTLEAMTPAAFAAETGVSRETLARLESYADLLRRWQRSVNLVSPSTVPDLWRRHMLDSAQLWPLLPETRRLVDIGSGAGFPGLVLSILGVPEVHLIESDRRKAAFLAEAARVTAAPALVHAGRAEDPAVVAAVGGPADVVTARALAPLPRLLEHAAPYLAQHTVCVFLKGRNVDQELTDAAISWTMAVDRVPSRSDPGGTVLRLGALGRVT